jgi:hypothetical protein
VLLDFPIIRQSTPFGVTNPKRQHVLATAM